MCATLLFTGTLNKEIFCVLEDSEQCSSKYIMDSSDVFSVHMTKWL